MPIIPEGDAVNLDTVIKKEKSAWLARREALNLDKDAPLLGVSLSGGGVRSATLSAGFLDVLRRIGLLKHVDYLSTVSGGGFLGGYVHEKLRHHADTQGRATEEAYEALFSDDDLDTLRRSARYLAPGVGFKGLLNAFVMGIAYVVSTLINLIWLLSFVASIVLLASLPLKVLDVHLALLTQIVVTALLTVLLWHLLMHGARHFRVVGLPVWSSIVLNAIESILVGLLLVVLAASSPLILQSGYPELMAWLAIALSILIVTGIVSNPNVLTMHRYYRDRLANAFLNAAHKGGSSRRLHELAIPTEFGGGVAGPFPLINTCLNLAGSDQSAGHQASDYFLMSPQHCGAKLVHYVEASSSGYRKMTLATAIAASGAALNPGMGSRSSKFVAFLLAMMNLRLGYWVHNPRFEFKWLTSLLSPWWYYQVSELMSRTDAKKRVLNISDGGFVDNLGVIELLRRRCEIIICLDATADPDYEFADLTNLVIRARNELGLNIKFRDGQDPEDVIRPKPSRGYSESQFAIADISAMEGNDAWSDYAGTLIYVKSSLLQQKLWQDAEKWQKESQRSYHYKTYHASFPHESTANQFFDADQWQAYYDLGTHLAASLARVRVAELYADGIPPINPSHLWTELAKIHSRENLFDYRLESRSRSV